MPKNRFMYAGVLITAAAALLWLGKLLTNLVDPMLPYAAGTGIALILIGVFLEAQQGKESLKPGTESGEPLITMPDPVAPIPPVADEHSSD